MDSTYNRKYGVFNCVDTGPPNGPDSDTYITIAIIHGYGFTSGENQICTYKIAYSDTRHRSIQTPYTRWERA